MYQKRKIHKRAVAAALLFSLTVSLAQPVRAAQPVLTVSAQSAILVNAADGTVLWQKNAAQKRPMASTTKIMTALLALEAAACHDRAVDITADMLQVEGSSMGLQTGDRITLSGLAAGMLSTSGNDAATASAYALAGGPVAFARMMNQRAQELGMRDTHFVTPSGLDDEAHYSTAADMAKLACAAMKNSAFAALTAKRTVRVQFAQPACTRAYTNHNKLLAQYSGCIGVKTGFTKKAGRCLVSCAERKGVRLVAVTLNAPDDWQDHRVLLDYGFTQLKSVTLDDSAYTAELPLVGGQTQTAHVHGEKGAVMVLPVAAQLTRQVELPHFLYAPLENGDLVGRVVYRLNDREVGHTVLAAEPAAAVSVHHQSFWQWLQSLFVH